MKKIEMADIRSQYMRLKPEIDAAVSGVLHSSAFIRGPEVTAFSRELADYLSVPYVIPCANGTDALQISLMALGLQPGDEVITTGFTFISTVEVLVLLGLKPVLADVDPNTFTLDPEAVRAAITPKTRAILPVHLFGQAAGLERILKLATEFGIPVLEDNAQSLGAGIFLPDSTRRMAGTLGVMGTTSFFPTKPLACYGDGGAIFTSDSVLAEKAAMITNHGARVKYYHDIIGVNSRLDSIQAAILRVNLRHLGDFIERRQRVARLYDERLGQDDRIATPHVDPNGDHVYHQYTILLDPAVRDRVREKLSVRGIPAMIYYPVPLSLQPAFAFAGYREGDFPVSENLCRSVLSLPIHTEMEDDQLNHICANLLDILNHE
jgi:dTDP-4-amino-4,6-dideoxygalactose transaminase